MHSALTQCWQDNSLKGPNFLENLIKMPQKFLFRPPSSLLLLKISYEKEQGSFIQCEHHVVNFQNSCVAGIISQKEGFMKTSYFAVLD